jgi:hypothetical protein
MLPAGVTWERVAEVFAAALDHPIEERDGFLATTCGEDSALSSEVRSLLENHGFAGDFLELTRIALGPPLSPSLLSAIEHTPLFAQFAPEDLVGIAIGSDHDSAAEGWGMFTKRGTKSLASRARSRCCASVGTQMRS